VPQNDEEQIEGKEEEEKIYKWQAAKKGNCPSKLAALEII